MPRRALVTGASGGIGTAIVERLRADGFEVVTLDVRAPADVVADLVTDELPDLSGIDVCVSNAAIVDTIAPAHRMSPQQWQRDIDANLTGAFRAVQACLNGMRERRWGRIVLISSCAAELGLPGQVAYAASKAGLQGMARTLATENVGHGITVNTILPGMIATPKVLGMPGKVLERVNAKLPMGRLGDPHEIAALVAFFAGDDAAYITGQDLRVDGGLGLLRMSLGT